MDKASSGRAWDGRPRSGQDPVTVLSLQPPRALGFLKPLHTLLNVI